jgi:aryl-alcohol dehydrogenase-like predicted oxidoreductase
MGLSARQVGHLGFACLGVLAAVGMGWALAQLGRHAVGRVAGTLFGACTSGLLIWGAPEAVLEWDPKLPEALAHGITYWDAAWRYTGGTNELAIGSFVERTGKRGELWITSKSDLHDPAGFEKRLGESLTRMKTKHVDMYFLHGLRDPRLLDGALQQKVEQL